jgi:hypothetical protein
MNSFDDQLARANPPAPVHTSELDDELLFVIAEAERLATRTQSRHRRRVVTGGLAALALIGTGTAAAAAGGILPWFDDAPSRGVVTTSTGAECELVFGVKGHSDPAHPVDSATRATAVAAAEAFLERLDLSSIDVDEAAAGLPPRATFDSEAGPAESVDEYETYAVMAEVEDRVNAALEKQGLPTGAVSVSMFSSCDGDE